MLGEAVNLVKRGQPSTLDNMMIEPKHSMQSDRANSSVHLQPSRVVSPPEGGDYAVIWSIW